MGIENVYDPGWTWGGGSCVSGTAAWQHSPVHPPDNPGVSSLFACSSPPRNTESCLVKSPLPSLSLLGKHDQVFGLTSVLLPKGNQSVSSLLFVVATALMPIKAGPLQHWWCPGCLPAHGSTKNFGNVECKQSQRELTAPIHTAVMVCETGDPEELSRDLQMLSYCCYL